MLDINAKITELARVLSTATRLLSEIQSALPAPSSRAGLQPPVPVIPDINDVEVPVEGDLDPPPPPRYDHDTHGWDDPFADVIERPLTAPGVPSDQPAQPRTPVRPPPSTGRLGKGSPAAEAPKMAPAQPAQATSRPAAASKPALFTGPTGQRWVPPRPPMPPRPHMAPLPPKSGFVSGLAAEQKKEAPPAFQKPRLPTSSAPKPVDDDDGFPGDWDRRESIANLGANPEDEIPF